MDHLAERACGSSGVLRFRDSAREVALEDDGQVELLPPFVGMAPPLVGVESGSAPPRRV
jgi:hypothetical protein